MRLLAGPARPGRGGVSARPALGTHQPVMGFRQGPWTAKAHLPGGDIPNADFDRFREAFEARHPWLDRGLAGRLARAYGTRAERVLAGAKGPEGLGREVAPGLY